MSDDNKILLCWIPSCTGISENEKVNNAALSALRMVPEKNFLNSIYGVRNKNKQINTPPPKKNTSNVA